MMKRPTGSLWLDTFFARKTTDRDLTGRMIVFTGGTDGIGRAAGGRFAAMGAEICLFGRDPQSADRNAYPRACGTGPRSALAPPFQLVDSMGAGLRAAR